ncbi:MAG: OmcA/MtrC family decaheme c-type cytochrome, partial [Acidobacteriota bacterium]|nr:OmcA/MtrC family decaheme c-type cytochrome [Acidobacteriota bacterium]
VGLENFTKLNPATDLTASYPNFTFTIAKLIPAAGPIPSKWVNYVVMTTPNVKHPTSVPTGPTTDGNGSLVGHGDGTYTYTFATDITQVASAVTAYGKANSVDVSALDPTDLAFDPNAETRVVMEFFGNARGTGSGQHANTPDGSAGTGTAEIQHPINVVYDFTPATGAPVAPSATSREIVTMDTCNTCHTRLAYHGGHRVDPRNCVICHTDQRRYGSTEATRNASETAFTSGVDTVNGTAEYDFRQMIHQIHMGSNLQMAGHDITPDNTADWSATSGVAGEYSINFPTNIINCTICHVSSAATPQAGNWQTTPSRAACGGCHDNVDFTTGVNHIGGPRTDDTQCSGCHTPTLIATYHTPLMSPSENGTDTAPSYNPYNKTYNWQATNPNNLPAGAASISYKLVSATVNAAGNPVVQFQILANGTPVALNPFVPGTTPVTGEAMPTGFAAGPNFMLTMGVPQDGITPTDYNYGHQDKGSWNLRQIWNHTALATKSSSTLLLASQGIVATSTAGTYQITMDGIVVPTGTQLVGVGMGFAGIVQTNLTPSPFLANRPGGAPDFTWTPATAAVGQGTGGVLLPAKTIWTNVTGNGFIARRQIIKDGACESCHGNLGAFTTNGPTTAMGTPINEFHDNYMNNGAACVFCHYSNGTSGGFSYNAKTWVHALHAAGMRNNPYTIQANFPGIKYPGLLNDCEACHVPGSYDFSNAANAAQIPGMLWDTVATGKGTTASSTPTFTSGPWVDYTTVYGPTAAFVAPATPSATWNLAQPTDYAESAVASPITAACAACHDTTTAVSHMTQNGGVWYVQRQNVPTMNANGSYTGAQNPAAIKLQSNEQCLVCHGSGAIADIKSVHMNY